MHKIERPEITIYFGNMSASFPGYLYRDREAHSIHPRFQTLSKNHGVSTFIFLEQIHSASGIVVNEEYARGYASQQVMSNGDYLLTDVPNIGLGVYTADCLPIILYDAQHHVASISHAGRKGSMKGVIVEALKHMSRVYGTRPQQIEVYFGPSAQICCYEVNDEIAQEAVSLLSTHESIVVRDDAVFFDLIRYNAILLERAGIDPLALDLSGAHCTICSELFCSYRRQGASGPQQLSFVCLR